ncbi:hypothetical protein HRbin22_01002 [Candidatus Thermoflexus japonica]|uniref:Uncharacterized protein n=1 Tax=Candidatus Thermoflexus japonica TaxID=2035417 RepID=A0A2H5Y5P0_9CHLR|nr:hypothetical protein HRbin22_01002 [Candidatus Thermoflexus japonica]
MKPQDALAYVVGTLALPYGYTVTMGVVWAMAREHYQGMTWRDGLAFLLGAVGAFGLLAGISRSYMPGRIPAPLPSSVALNGMAIVAAMGGVGICIGIPTSWLGSLSASFIATTLYVLSVAMLAYIGERRTRTSAERAPESWG